MSSGSGGPTGSRAPAADAPLRQDEVEAYAAALREHKAASDGYLAATPELHELVKALVAAVLRDRPEDVRAYAADFCAHYVIREDGHGMEFPAR